MEKFLDLTGDSPVWVVNEEYPILDDSISARFNDQRLVLTQKCRRGEWVFVDRRWFRYIKTLNDPTTVIVGRFDDICCICRGHITLNRYMDIYGIYDICDHCVKSVLSVNVIPCRHHTVYVYRKSLYVYRSGSYNKYAYRVQRVTNLQCKCHKTECTCMDVIREIFIDVNIVKYMLIRELLYKDLVSLVICVIAR